MQTQPTERVALWPTPYTLENTQKLSRMQLGRRLGGNCHPRSPIFVREASSPGSQRNRIYSHITTRHPIAPLNSRLPPAECLSLSASSPTRPSQNLPHATPPLPLPACYPTSTAVQSFSQQRESAERIHRHPVRSASAQQHTTSTHHTYVRTQAELHRTARFIDQWGRQQRNRHERSYRHHHQRRRQ